MPPSIILEPLPGLKLPARPVKLDKPIVFKKLAIGIYSPNGTKCCLSNIALMSPCSFININEFRELFFSLRTIPATTAVLGPAAIEISFMTASLSLSNLDIDVSGHITTFGDVKLFPIVRSKSFL